MMRHHALAWFVMSEQNENASQLTASRVQEKVTMKPFVSIIIPAKNEERVIDYCLSALANVDYPRESYEVIVVDNGSVDRTVAIAQDYGFIIRHCPHLTIAGLRNAGAEMARGDVIAFVDADVAVLPDWLARGIAALMTEGVACAGCMPGIPDNATWVEQIWNLQNIVMPEKCDREWLASMNMLIWKKCFDEIKGFNTGLHTCEDVDFGYRLRKKYRIISDKNIRAVHLGEAKTLLQLFRKESWRGIGNFHGIKSHGLLLKEVPSHAVALYYFMFEGCVVPLAVYWVRPAILIFMAVFALAFPLYKACEISFKMRSFIYVAKLMIVWLVYCFARGWSVWRAIVSDCKRD